MIHPATELRFINDDIGYGVFARRAIPRGTVLWVLCRLDMVFTAAEAAAFPPPYRPILDRYAYTDGRGRVVLCWDHGRYVNHSCDPVMLGVGNDVEIAVRDIAAGEELTCEYATLNPTEAMVCHCGAGACRGVVGPDDVLTLWPDLDRRVAATLPSARAVAQPLLPYMDDAEAFWACVDGRAPLPSCRDYHLAARRQAAAG
jgi:hypothetical protein